jgi:hypothetical protein
MKKEFLFNDNIIDFEFDEVIDKKINVKVFHYFSNNLLFEKIEDRIICLKGIGKLFFQEGFPISLSISVLKEQGVEVSILHVADECLKNGWSPITTYNKLKSDFEEDIDKENHYDLHLLKKFCESNYEDQREMIFEYLFKCKTDDVRNKKNENPIDWLQLLVTSGAKNKL